MNLDPQWDEHSGTWQGVCGKCKENFVFYDDAAEEEREFSPEQLAFIKTQEAEALKERDEDLERWNDDEPKLNANARAEEEFGKRLEQRGPGER